MWNALLSNLSPRARGAAGSRPPAVQLIRVIQTYDRGNRGNPYPGTGVAGRKFSTPLPHTFLTFPLECPNAPRTGPQTPTARFLRMLRRTEHFHGPQASSRVAVSQRSQHRGGPLTGSGVQGDTGSAP